MPSSKTIDVVVRIRCPKWLTQAQARREVRTLINDQTHHGHVEPCAARPWDSEVIGAENFRAVAVKPAPQSR
ncbi:hypothetical protein GCM10011349_32300 [Novosphingobium indicum]|jgi:hypothetical protein|uniref:Uncharacterized protein n=1 Tax=Novosphingobium indicum TaxID=462949 RepID=A0ABQ2JVK8_9SPHN|nr:MULTISPECIES: hypothetical protein [Novosphingobium]GGN55542.1 hypothetical protein GCM10011349_32300 [Novosphingobium indicum]